MIDINAIKEKYRTGLESQLIAEIELSRLQIAELIKTVDRQNVAIDKMADILKSGKTVCLHDPTHNNANLINHINAALEAINHIPDAGKKVESEVAK